MRWSTVGGYGTMLLLCMSLLPAQSLNPIPGSVTDLSAQARLPHEFSFEQQIQAGTQSNSSAGSPFGYWHAVQIRPWVHYDGIRDLTITGSASYIYSFAVAGTTNYKHSEWRFVVFGTLKQRLAGGSLYEQL